MVILDILLYEKRSEMYLCGSVSTHGTMDLWIDPSCSTRLAISHSSQCSITGVTKV